MVVNAGINAVVMTHTDFRSFDDAISKGAKLRALVKSNTRPYLSKVKSATVVRGSHLLRFRTSFSAPWVKYDLLNSTFVINNAPARNTKDRGVNQKKLLRLRASLLELMDPQHRAFWQGLFSSQSAADLCNRT